MLDLFYCICLKSLAHIDVEDNLPFGNVQIICNYYGMVVEVCLRMLMKILNKSLAIYSNVVSSMNSVH